MRRWGVLTEMSRVYFSLKPGHELSGKHALQQLSEMELNNVQDVYGHDGQDFKEARLEVKELPPQVPFKMVMNNVVFR